VTTTDPWMSIKAKEGVGSLGGLHCMSDIMIVQKKGSPIVCTGPCTSSTPWVHKELVVVFNGLESTSLVKPRRV
jgi:hypothetical protein